MAEIRCVAGEKSVNGCDWWWGSDVSGGAIVGAMGFRWLKDVQRLLRMGLAGV